ncbi:MAG: serine/threonine protein kinase [Acidobacteriia bacterium]|nr:serine/threonine protein kinase [Terriglobia bacterium]
MLRFASLAEGSVFAGRYEIREPLGAGGTGEIFHAFDRIARTDVALKVLFPGATDRDLDRLRRELRVVRSLQHPGILRVHDIGESDGLFFIVSELLRGESVASRIRREGRLAPDEAERILRGILEALGVAHDAGVIHRDIKPGNVFLAESAGGGPPRIVLLDFGFARPVRETGLTATGRFVGTPEYCSPEQILGERDLGPATDLYSCGVTLWEMLSGRPPFQGTSEADVFRAHLDAPPPRARVELAACPPRLRALTLRLLEKRPEDRPGDASRALEWLDRRFSAADRLAGAARGLRLAAARRKGRVAAGGAAGLLILALLALALIAPVRVGWEVDRLVWQSRGGPTIRGAASGRGITAIASNPDRGIFTTDAFVAQQPMPLGEDTPFDGSNVPPMLYRVRLPFDWRHPLLTAREQGELFGVRPYRFYNPMLVPRRLFALGPLARGEAPLLAVTAYHPCGYPCRLVLLEEGGTTLYTYDHPGYIESVKLCTVGGKRRPILLIGGFNNLLGPREVLFALSTNRQPRGQAPPFTGASVEADTALWYLPLPYDASTGDFDVEVSGSTADVKLTGNTRIAVSLENGVPLEAARRGGLSEDEWSRSREKVMAALAGAAKLAGAGDAAGGAAALEAAAADAKGVPILRSIALYWAARLRIETAREAGEPALLSALALVRQVIDEEPEPPRYRLLEAEILARLGWSEEARRALLAWSARPSHRMYQYEWFLIGWLAGLPPEIRSVSEDEGGPDHGVEDHLVRMADRFRRNDPEGAAREALRLTPMERPWQVLLYLLAESRLVRPVSDPAAALGALTRAERSRTTGVPVPLHVATLRACIAMGRDPGREDVQRAARDLDDIAGHAFSSIESLFLLKFAADDAEWVLSRRPDLSELRPGAALSRALADRWSRFGRAEDALAASRIPAK